MHDEAVAQGGVGDVDVEFAVAYHQVAGVLGGVLAEEFLPDHLGPRPEVAGLVAFGAQQAEESVFELGGVLVGHRCGGESVKVLRLLFFAGRAVVHQELPPVHAAVHQGGNAAGVRVGEEHLAEGGGEHEMEQGADAGAIEFVEDVV